MFKGNVSFVPMNCGNTGEDFENARKHGADGTIPQATGLSEAAAWNDDDNYETVRMHAGRKNGTFPAEHIGRSKKIRFAEGHKFEKETAEMNTMIMELDSGLKIDCLDASQEEWRNDAWPSICAHLDFLLVVHKGKAILNPNFVIGGPEKNYKLIPDANDHTYIADAKTVQSFFGSNWAERDENGVPIGGLKYGIAPTHYRQQQLGYCGICHIEGAFLLGWKGEFGEHNYAQVFIPYDKEEAETILDQVEKRNTESRDGIIPAVADCKDVKKAIHELPLQFPDVNVKKKTHELKDEKWKKSFERLGQIDEETANIDSIIKPYIDELKKKVADETGLKVKSASITIKEKSDLTDERKDILMLPLEEVKNGPSCYFVDKDTGDFFLIEYGAGVKWDKATKAAIAEDYPEVFEGLKQRFPDKAPKLSKGDVAKAKKR